MAACIITALADTVALLAALITFQELIGNQTTEASRVESAGGKIQKEKVSLGQYGFMVLAIDTEGNMFGLHSQN